MLSADPPQAHVVNHEFNAARQAMLWHLSALPGVEPGPLRAIHVPRKVHRNGDVTTEYLDTDGRTPGSVCSACEALCGHWDDYTTFPVAAVQLRHLRLLIFDEPSPVR